MKSYSNVRTGSGEGNRPWRPRLGKSKVQGETPLSFQSMKPLLGLNIDEVAEEVMKITSQTKYRVANLELELRKEYRK